MSSTLCQQFDYANLNSYLQLTIHILNGKNYLEQVQYVDPVIDDKGKLDHLTSKVMKPATNGPNLKTQRFEKSMVIVCLINSMEPTIKKPYMFLLMFKEDWDVIHDTYLDLKNSTYISKLKRKFWQSKKNRSRGDLLLQQDDGSMARIGFVL